MCVYIYNVLEQWTLNRAWYFKNSEFKGLITVKIF